MTLIAHFDIPYFQYLDEMSRLHDSAPTELLITSNLIKLYRLMVLLRMFDCKAIALQRTGKLGTYPSTRGQEATFVGIGAGMQPTDVFVPYYRDVGTLIQRGVTLSDILLYWGGDERGNAFYPESEDFPYSVPVGSQPLHATGIATAIKIRQQKRAVLTVCGDGASSQGDFYEAMNVAGAWKLPVVFVVSNNQWAISVPRSAQSATETIAQKAIAAGFNGEQVDGNDVIAVQARIQHAMQQAREQHIPTLLEIITYRQSDHTTADDASRYEPQGVREKEWEKEPIQRLKKYLEDQNLWTESQEQTLQQECQGEVDLAVQTYLNTPVQPPESMFDYLYSQLPPIYNEQRDHVSQKESVAHG